MKNHGDPINDDMGPEFKTGPLFGEGTPIMSMNDFVFSEAAGADLKPPEEGIEIDNADVGIDYAEIVKNDAFKGDTPFETILEGIEAQFNDYLSLEDQTNYVEKFYSQLHESYRIASQEEADHPEESINALNDYLDQFIAKVVDLFGKRLSISFMSIDGEDYDQDALEYQISTLYEFFILRGRENLKNVITKDVCAKMGTPPEDDKVFFNMLNETLRYYSPLIIAIGPMEFLRIAGADDIIGFYEDDQISGNFLRKFSPRFFDHEDFEVEVTSNIVMHQQVKDELLNMNSESQSNQQEESTDAK